MKMRVSVLCAIAVLACACATTPPRVDPYTGLLPPGFAMKEAAGSALIASDLRNQTVYLLTGANFEAYAGVWKKYAESQRGGNLAYSSAEMEHITNSWSPTNALQSIASVLRQHFKSVVVVADLAEARAKNARWIVVFDHAFETPSPMLPIWVNTTVIDLLNGDLQRVVRAEHSQRNEESPAMSNAQAMAIARKMGEYIKQTSDRAVQKFDSALRAASR